MTCKRCKGTGEVDFTFTIWGVKRPGKCPECKGTGKDETMDKDELEEIIRRHQYRVEQHTSELERYKKQLAALKRPKIVQGRFVTAPEVETLCYVIMYGFVEAVEWDGYEDDLRCLGNGDVFATRDAAEQSLLKRKALQAMRGCEGAKEFECGEDNYHAVWSHNTKKWTILDWTSIEPVGDIVWFDTEKHASAAINSLSPEMQEALR